MQYLALSILIFCSLQASNCNLSEKQSEEITLISVVKKGDPAEVQEFLLKGADPNSKDADGHTALDWACCYDSTGNIVKILLQEGAKIDIKDKDDWISFDWAYKGDHPIVIKQLIQKAIELGKLTIQGYDGKTLLHYAAALDDANSGAIVTQLLKLGLDPNAKDADNHIPLYYAKKKEVRIKLYFAANNPS